MLKLLILLATTSSVPWLTFYEGVITGMGSRGDGNRWFLVDRKTRQLHADTSDFGLKYGDWVRVACTSRCWVMEFERRSDAP